MNQLTKHAAEVRKELAAGNFEQTDSGLYMPRMGALVRGVYRHYINGEYAGEDHNLVPTEGLNHLLNVGIGATAKAAGWYVALFSGAVAPAANWTAANFAATANEITSATEGFVGDRPAFTVVAASNGIVNNAASRATFNIVCTSQLTVQGAAVLSSNTRGGTSGVLMSAARYAAARTFNNSDIYDCEYELQLTAQ